MIQADLLSISQKLHVSVPVLQKMPLDQISRLSDMIRVIPDIFQFALQDVSADDLLGERRTSSCVIAASDVFFISQFIQVSD
jgi:hypothetical protein